MALQERCKSTARALQDREPVGGRGDRRTPSLLGFVAAALARARETALQQCDLADRCGARKSPSLLGIVADTAAFRSDSEKKTPWEGRWALHHHRYMNSATRPNKGTSKMAAAMRDSQSVGRDVNMRQVVTIPTMNMKPMSVTTFTKGRGSRT